LPSTGISSAAICRPCKAWTGCSCSHPTAGGRSATRALRLVIHEIVPFDEAQRALDLVLARHVRGKVVLTIV
jgi:isopentenyldiphosphate isomerase